MFEPILPALRELIQYSTSVISTARFCPVADIAHRFFLVDPPPTTKLATETKTEIARLVRSINHQLNTISESCLKTISTLVLVAGSTVKAQAIRTLLCDRTYGLRYLVTDEPTARAIVSMGRT